MKISIVIPSYNSQELLEKNLPKVVEAARWYEEKYRGEIEIIVVNDGIDKESQNYKLQVKSIQTKEHRGFSSTVNRGVKEASGEIVVLLNTDVSPEQGFLEPLIAHFPDPKVFAVGCLDKSLENGKTILRGRGVGKWQKGFLIHKKGEVDKTNTLWVSGGSGAFRKLIWDKLGGFNELYNPFYWEDIDLSYRALKSGYKVLFEPKSVVIHEHEKGAIKKKYSSFQIKTIAYRNQFIFVWNNVTDLNLVILHTLWFPYHFVKALIGWDWAFFLGFFQALIRIPRVIQSSLKVQKLFIKTDAEAIREFSE